MSRVALLVVLAAALSVGGASQAAPIVAVLDGTDGNFQFSVVHTSTGGSDGQSGSILGNIDLGGAGGDWTVAAGIGTLDIQLSVDVGGSVSVYDAIGDFDVAALVEMATQADVMLGSLAFTLVSGADDAAIGGETFYFENRNYSSASNPPNALQGDFLTLWGATLFTGTAVLGESMDLVAGGRGIDLRVQIAPPIPEPSARPLYMAGLAVVALGATRLRRA